MEKPWRNIKYGAEDAKNSIEDISRQMSRLKQEIEWFMEEPNDTEDFKDYSYKTIDKLQYDINMLKTDIYELNANINNKILNEL